MHPDAPEDTGKTNQAESLTRSGAVLLLVRLLQATHYAILAWALVGWMIPSNAWLTAYLICMPMIAVQWLLNRNTCIMNNLESWLTTGQWRDTADPNQGGFIAGVLDRVTGWRPNGHQTNMISYGLLAAFCLLAFAHLFVRGAI